ncbi:hypothetical protein Ddye_022872 [Dipteronia dyeriana]|uniref:Uncharacterized protein n=1 Tax=Dipteronia dyeriana TaxID=168575 RepID=A0AAD9TRX0_9ROSI|nr:hypothetical protein Ddye_022872 [Dipteronia dyeriana]
MRSRLKDFPKTLEGDWYKGKLTRHDHFEALARIDDELNRVPEDFAVEDRCWFMAYRFRHFMSRHREKKFSGGVILRLLLWELDYNGPTGEMRFLLWNHLVMFSKVEFYLITGLRFGVVPDTSLYAAVENDIHQRYFPGADEVSFKELMVDLTLREFQEVCNVMKLCLIFMLNGREIQDFSLAVSVFAFEVISDLGIQFGDRKTTTGGSSGEGSEEKGRGGRPSETEASDPEGPGFNAMDTDGSEPSLRRVRHRRVQFTTPGHAASRGDSRADIGRDMEAPWEHQFNELR